MSLVSSLVSSLSLSSLASSPVLVLLAFEISFKSFSSSRLNRTTTEVSVLEGAFDVFVMVLSVLFESVCLLFLDSVTYFGLLLEVLSDENFFLGWGTESSSSDSGDASGALVVLVVLGRFLWIDVYLRDGDATGLGLVPNLGLNQSNDMGLLNSLQNSQNCMLLPTW